MANPALPPAKPTLTEQAYKMLKFTTTVLLPGLSTLYFTLAQILGLPAAEQVVGCIAAVNVFLGLILAQSSKNFNNSDNPLGRYDGDLAVVQTDGGKQMVNFVFNQEPEQILAKPQVVMKVTEVDRNAPRHAV